MIAETWESRFQRWIQSAVVVYWPLMFISTHWPDVDVPLHTPGVPFDKVAHFTMYAGLTTLLGLSGSVLGLSALDTKTPQARPRAWAALGALVMTYALFDEFTQPFFLRDFEWLDLLADGLGTATAMIVLATLALWRLTHARPASTTAD